MLGTGALGRPRGMEWGGRREEGSGWGTHVYLWRIHFDIWQKATTFCKAIVLQLKKYFLKCACTQILFLNKISNSVDLWSGPRRTKKPLDESERAE